MASYEITTTRRGLYLDILSHLAENLDAGDTVEGIAEWWLLEQEIRFQFHEIEAALDKLVSGGLLLKRDTIDSRAIYWLNQNKLEEIRATLDQLSDCGCHKRPLALTT